MENTSALLFDNSQPRFFLALSGKAVGPLTTQELYDRLAQGQCSFLHYAWCEGWDDWRTVSEVEEFRKMVPAKPDKAFLSKIKTKMTERKRKLEESAASATVEERTWFLHTGDSQHGPFSQGELMHALDAQNLGGESFVWKAGWASWKSMKDVPELASSLRPQLPVTPAPPPLPQKKDLALSAPAKALSAKSQTKTKTKALSAPTPSERRGSPRRPLVARLFVHNNEEVVVAVCRDISIGGMQVLTDRVPGAVGTTLRLNVSPSDAKTVKGFVAEGEIVRVLEDGRGFSFRFTKLSEDARRAITSYIKAGV